MDPVKGGECAVEKRVDWLHGGAEDDIKKLPEKAAADSYNPFSEGGEENEGSVIDQYFVAEESKAISGEKKVEQMKAIPEASSDRSESIDAPERPSAQAAAEEKSKKPDKAGKKGDLVDWLIVD